jgi:putative regulatory protein, FmdB family
MPIYEYQCQACGHEHEALQKLSAEPLKICPACSQPELMKKISAAGFRLKGGGWYETDFKSGAKKNVAGDTPSSTPAASATSGSKSN